MSKSQFLLLTSIALIVSICLYYFPLGGANVSLVLLLIIRSVSVTVLAYNKYQAIDKRGIVFLGFSIFIALPNALYTYNTLIYRQYFLSFVCAITGTILVSNKNPMSRWKLSFLESYLGNIIMSITGFGLYRRSFTTLHAGEIIDEASAIIKVKKEIIMQIIKGVVIGAPILIIVTALLASSDKMFTDMLIKARDILPTVSFSGIGDIIAILCIMLGVVSYLSYTFFVQKYENTHQTLELMPQNNKHTVSIISFLTLLVIIIGAYSIVQIQYMFGVLELPAGYSMAEYIRSGFYQVIVSSIIILSTFIFLKSYFIEQKIKNIFLSILLIQNIFILYSSFDKTSNAMSLYGYTFLKLISLSLILTIGILSLIALYKQYNNKVNIPKVYILLLMSRFTIIGLINLDLISVRDNVSRYGLENGKQLDYLSQYINGFGKKNSQHYGEYGYDVNKISYEAIPYLIELEKSFSNNNSKTKKDEIERFELKESLKKFSQEGISTNKEKSNNILYFNLSKSKKNMSIIKSYFNLHLNKKNTTDIPKASSGEYLIEQFSNHKNNTFSPFF